MYPCYEITPHGLKLHTSEFSSQYIDSLGVMYDITDGVIHRHGRSDDVLAYQDRVTHAGLPSTVLIFEGPQITPEVVAAVNWGIACTGSFAKWARALTEDWTDAATLH